MKTNAIILTFLIGVLSACSVNTDNNQSFDYDKIEVNFSAISKDIVFSTGDDIGVLAFCTRGGTENTVMKSDLSATGISKYIPLADGDNVQLKAAGEEDAVIAEKGDHNFKFYGIYPCPEGEPDVTAIPMSVPEVQKYSDGLKSYVTLVAAKAPARVIATQELEFRTFFSVLSLKVAQDIITEGVPAVLRSITLKAVTPENLEDPLSVEGICNADLMSFTPNASTGKKEITVDFGTEGLELEDDYTAIPMLINPFYVPEGGLELTLTDVGGKTNTIKLLAEAEDNGRAIVAGETVELIVDGINDGIVPVTFPVIFPMGYPAGENTGYNKDTEWIKNWTSDTGFSWSTTTPWSGHHGTVLCKDQNQAYVKWVWDEKITGLEIKTKIEVVNTTDARKISTFGVKGIWTDDFFEFVIPVKKFKANTTLCLEMPIYTRGGPVFWEVLYLDGETWRSTATENLPAEEGSEYKATATWAVQKLAPSKNIDTDCKKSVNMTFTEAIPSGNIHIKVRCVDGSIVAGDAADNTTNIKATKVTAPVSNASGQASASFYFWNPGSISDHPISISIVK